MGLWSYLCVEERQEVIDLLSNTRRFDEKMGAAIEAIEEKAKGSWQGAPSRWYRLRAEWLGAAIEELGGDTTPNSAQEER